MFRITLGVLTSSILLLALAVLVSGSFISAPKAETRTERRADANVLRYPSGAPQLSALKIAPAAEFPVPLAEPLNGRVTYNENFTARVSSPIAGRIVVLRAQAGDTVKAGDLLAALNSPDLAQAVADLRKAEADEARKKLAFDRAMTLYQGEVIARKDLESAEADYAQAKAETQRAALRLRNLDPRGGVPDADRYLLRAPISGVVADRKANPAMEVRPDTPDPLFVITDPARLWVLIDLPERYLSKVGPGQRVLVEVDAYPGEGFPAKIERVGEVVDPATRRVQVRCAIANPQRRLKPEMYARVTLLADESRKAIRVPNTALVTEGLYSYVFVEKTPGEFVRSRVALAVQDRDYSYVASGLAAGDRIVVAGSLLLNSELESAQ